MPRFALTLPFQIDHIIAEKHGRLTVESNLALACPHCNRFKGPNIAGVRSHLERTGPPISSQERQLGGALHLEGARIVGRTSIGRVTIQVLAMNADDLLLIRIALGEEGYRFQPGTARGT